ncbi:hypothetical protein [Butyrivibrio sp. WCD2001]|uniref:hypothetical protein n=1 Tax=Butyrivibrio sp. WCD2001 TaxID=1280681 RepID=UPI00047E3949|nr:hypothetical protein [Butyrivibrio sp. WCD2001]
MNIKSLSIFMISAMMCGLLTSCGKTGNDEVVTEPVEIEEDVLPLEAVEDPLEATEDPLEATEDPLGKTEEPQEISKELQHDLNIFLSNFSEQGYNCAGYDPAEWAHFTLVWKILNDPSGLKYENDRTWIDQSSVNNILGRYFGSNLEEGDFFGAGDNNPYNGTIEISEDNIAWYTEPSVDGETYLGNAFTVVTGLQRIPGDYYDFLRTEFTIYAVNDMEYEDYGVSTTYYSLTAAEADKLADEGRIIPKATGVAIIDDVVSNGYGDSYWLDDYNILE